MTSPEAVTIVSPSPSSTSPDITSSEPASLARATTPSSSLFSTRLRISSTKSMRLEISRSRPDVSTFACACAGAAAAAPGIDPELLSLALVGPGEIVQASSSVNSPCSGIGTCSIAMFDITRKRSSERSLGPSPDFSLLPNGHAISVPPNSH